MKKIVLPFFVFLSLFVSGQMLHPAQWTFTSEEKKDGNFELKFQVALDDA